MSRAQHGGRQGAAVTVQQLLARVLDEVRRERAALAVEREAVCRDCCALWPERDLDPPWGGSYR